jgi:hypothetical protein
VRRREMDFDFPSPYDVEVPRRIGEARQQLSPEGEEVLERILGHQGGPDDVAAAMERLPAPEGSVLAGIAGLLGEAYEASAQEQQGWADLHRSLEKLIWRAQELDPSLGDSATLGEAVAVLRRHGEPLGVSDEVLEMIVWVPKSGDEE